MKKTRKRNTDLDIINLFIQATLISPVINIHHSQSFAKVVQYRNINPIKFAKRELKTANANNFFTDPSFLGNSISGLLENLIQPWKEEK